LSASPVIEAAGGLVWRPSEGGRQSQERPPRNQSLCGTEVALVHRPKYDDWSLPKGKLEPGEHPLVAALREVEEEAGAKTIAGRPLGRSRYTVDGRPKRVQYWSMRWAGGEFRPNAEVDVIDWVPVEKAADRLKPDRDGFVVDEFLRDPRPTRACVVVRHARAGSRTSWKGRDVDRPLDAGGQEQARVLAELQAAYHVSRLYSSDVRRCIDTLAPFAADAGLTVTPEHLFSEAGYPSDPRGAATRALEIVREAGSVAICTQGGALPELVVALCRRLGTTPEGMKPVRKGSLVVVHLTVEDPLRVVAVEQLPAPAYR
jgi:8-oxo-dGTP pyrophosphatase MutT (NUDIX family)/phosphohistidine phosphatase SixA